jgi:hypothetical protein
MTTVTTKWLTVEVPLGFSCSVERADIVLKNLSNEAQVRIIAVRKDSPYSVTMDDAKQFTVGGDIEKPRNFVSKTISGHQGYFSSRTDEHHCFNTVIKDTLMLITSDGFDQTEAEASIGVILAGLTINDVG